MNKLILLAFCRAFKRPSSKTYTIKVQYVSTYTLILSSLNVIKIYYIQSSEIQENINEIK